MSEQFLKKTLAERKAFVVEKNLCFGYFSGQHIAKNCKERQTCKTCNKRHPTSLHNNHWKKPNDDSDKNKPEGEPRGSSNRTAIYNITEAGDIPVNMGVLLVDFFTKATLPRRLEFMLYSTMTVVAHL